MNCLPSDMMGVVDASGTDLDGVLCLTNGGGVSNGLAVLKSHRSFLTHGDGRVLGTNMYDVDMSKSDSNGANEFILGMGILYFITLYFCSCCRRGSNPRPSAYKTNALRPTELRQLQYINT